MPRPFPDEFEDAVNQSVDGEELDQKQLERLELARPTMGELLAVRHMVTPQESLFAILLRRFERIEAPLYEWCNAADEATEAEQEDAIHALALQRVRTVSADHGEISSAIGRRGPEDPVRKALEGRLKGRRRFGGE